MKRGACPTAERTTYLDVINADRQAQREQAAAPASARRKPLPPRARRDYPRREELQRDLARYYERCKSENVGRFKTKRRLKNYCAAVSWTIAKKAGRYPDYPWPRQVKETKTMPRRTPPRNSRGQFVKRSRGRASAAAPRTSRRPHHVKGYTMHRGGRAIVVRPHPSREYEAPAPRRRRSRSASAPRRSRSYSRARDNVVIVPAAPRRGRRGSPRRGRAREMFAYDAPRASLGGLVILGAGVIVGAALADFLHRWSTTQPTTGATSSGFTLPTGITTVQQYDAIAPLRLTGASAAWQFGLGLVGILAGAFLPWAPVRMFSYGVGLGALGHLGFQVLNQYVIEPMMNVGTSTVTANGQRYFGAENAAFPLLNPPAGTTPTPTPQPSGQSSGLMGQPMGRGLAAAAPAPALPVAQPRDRMPSTLGATPAKPPGPAPVPPVHRVVGPGLPPPVQHGHPVPPPHHRQPIPTPTPHGSGKPVGGCPSCGPDCTCVDCRVQFHGEPPPQQAPAPVAPPPASNGDRPHPLFAALRAA